MKLRYVVLVVGLGLPGWLYGQAKVGTSGAQFLEVGISARAVGMGESFLAVSDDVSALYYNPAGLTQLSRREVLLTHISYIADMRFEFGGLAYPLWGFGGVLGLGVYLLDAGRMEETTYEHPNGTGREFGAREYAVGLSYARSLTDHFSVGVTAKLIDELYEEYRATGWAADVGTLYDTGYRGFKIAMVISNFGPDMTFISQGHSLPINFKFGGSFNVLESGSHRATLAMEGSHPSDNVEKYATGLEYVYKEMFAVRVGEKFQVDQGGFSAGAGLILPVGERKLKLDYGYFDFGLLANVHRFSLAFTF